MRLLLKSLLGLALLAVVYLAADHLAPAPMARATLALQHRLAGLKPAQAEIPGFRIAYLDSQSTDAVPLVLVHGIGADKDNFGMLAMFLRDYRVIALDLPGFGASDKPLDGDYSITAQAEHLGQFLDALHLQQVHLGGNSMGGAIVLEYARQHPERVQSLWLLDPAGVRGHAKESEMLRRYREHGDMALFAQTPEQFAGVMDIAMARQPPLPYSLKHELALAAAANYPLHTRIFKSLVDGMPELDQTAAGLATPALIVWGELDRVLDVSGGEALHKALPNSQLVVLPGIGHLPMLEDPYHVAADYRRFRAGLAASH
ncbi:Pimeloyl-ACP methyl ester carboxylesterase [Solimonas aquatica]|uniref:Pimeloyl-ACP methyl ester carboxylesterase n=1 Tax=Solimonas aquatica TaxID=489703 RepID=A0A1H9KKY8_9GAMM|nr:alpha/beta fold hydrolase [Solimonas aquatica]SEQ99587.1 Pimeloyl-ACP methyl ester carboxylesterase [Solimonas aquatica]